MSLTLHSIQPKKGARKDSKRVGRGLGSKGTYSGRGVKGQRARSGGRAGLQLKGIRRLLLAQPKKRGFTSHVDQPETVNVADLSRAFADGSKVTPELIAKRALVKDASTGVKVLGGGAITIKIHISGCRVSAAAKEKIEKAGGTVVV